MGWKWNKTDVQEAPEFHETINCAAPLAFAEAYSCWEALRSTSSQSRRRAWKEGGSCLEHAIGTCRYGSGFHRRDQNPDPSSAPLQETTNYMSHA